MARFLFVGERRSPTAIRRDWTWSDGRLAGATLFAALRATGLDPTDRGRIRFCNLFAERDGRLAVHPAGLASVALASADGWTVVALGRNVQAALTHHLLPHLEMTHPAARGFIRKTERYRAHVAAVLAPPLEAA